MPAKIKPVNAGHIADIALDDGVDVLASPSRASARCGARDRFRITATQHRFDQRLTHHWGRHFRENPGKGAVQPVARGAMHFALRQRQQG